MSHSDLRSFLTLLEEREKLFTVREPINKDTELMPFFRLQMRGLSDPERKVMLFENVTNAKGERYSMRVVAGVYGVSEEVLALGMGCESRPQMLERWHYALENPIAPTMVEHGPVHQVVHGQGDLKAKGLDELPVPVEDPGFIQIIRTGMPMITRDPESGVRNVGTYNGFIRDRDRMVASIALVHDARRYHWETARRRDEELPVAIVIGATPNVMLASSASVPYGVDELAVAGAMLGEPVDMVRCKTIPLEVPAHAEIVIEGRLSTRVLEPRLGFSEYAGYITLAEEPRPVIKVTAITHRREALFTPILVGLYPTDHNAIWGSANSGVLYHNLRYAAQFPVEEVYFPQAGAGNDFCIIRLQRDASCDVTSLLHAAAELQRTTKYFVVVNYDIDPQDPELIFWALNYRVRPEPDIRMLAGRTPLLDPSAMHLEAGTTGRGQEHSRVLIDATMKGVFPPLGLPSQTFMENALEIWQRHGELPKLDLRTPWYGYTTGAWSDQDQALADLIAAGDYRSVGRMTADRQESVGP